MKLYDFPVAPSPRKVGIFIAEKGLNIPTTLINLREGDQSSKMFRAVNPRGTVLALELDDGTCLTESLAICHYLERFQPEPNLLGIDAKEQALILMWHDIATLDGYLGIAEAIRNSSELFKHRGLPGPVSYEQIPELVERGLRRSQVFFSDLEGRLTKSPYVAGNRFTYADIAAYVYVDWAARGIDIDPTEGRHALARWSEQISLRPSVGEAT